MTIADDVLDSLPQAPGVYSFKDDAGEVIYVGKAKNLRARVRQYFRGHDERLIVAGGYLPDAATSVETLIVSDEKEALLLENSLIKRHRPRFNVKLRDDKQYLVLRLARPVAPDLPASYASPATVSAGARATTGIPVPGPPLPTPLGATASAALIPPEQRAAVFPRIEVVRNIAHDSARYFGPYHSATSARQTLRALNRHFQLRTCTDHVLAHRGRTCLQYQIKRCPGPCALPVDPVAYAEQVQDVVMFLQGRDRELLVRLRTRMAEHAAREEFEVAATLRDASEAIERTLAKQHVVQDAAVDQDVWGLVRRADTAYVAVLFVRGGKLVGQRQFVTRDQELPDAEVVRGHVSQYYAGGAPVPDEVLLPVEVEDSEVLAQWLTGLRGDKASVLAPKRGPRTRLLTLAHKNADAASSSKVVRDAEPEQLLAKLQARLHLSRLPRRIECFDIAHTQGSETVASMVTFIDGVAAKHLYRKFKVRSVENNDFAAMREVIGRRFARALDDGDEGWAMPDLLVVDGGKGQLAMAVAALQELGIPLAGAGATSVGALGAASAIRASGAAGASRATGDAGPAKEIVGAFGSMAAVGVATSSAPAAKAREGVMPLDVVALAKERDLQSGEAPDRVYLRGAKDAIALRSHTAELYLLARLRDEAHRFANTFHRSARSRAQLTSQLDAIAGVGPLRRKRLLKQFGSVRALATARVEELAAVPGIGEALAQTILAALAAQTTPNEDDADASSVAQGAPASAAEATES